MKEALDILMGRMTLGDLRQLSTALDAGASFEEVMFRIVLSKVTA